MRRYPAILLFIGCMGCWPCDPGHAADAPAGFVERLGKTLATNIEAIIASQFVDGGRAGSFTLIDPYGPAAAETVKHWQAQAAHDTEVCAIRFTSEARNEYELHGFATPGEAEDAGFTVTHGGRCGSCSTLEDLAVYLSTPDLTTPARACSRRFGMAGKKQCFEDEIGFTPYCAESWAYNASQTKRECLGVCVGDYGFFNLLFHRYPGGNVDEAGRLRPCLQCDEDLSGPGFKYSAGRTRRNSGIESAIPRHDAEIYPVNHSAYFR